VPARARINPSALRSRLARCEKRLQALADEAAALDARLADPALYAGGDGQQVRELNADRARVAQQVTEVEAEWLELGEQLEAGGG
jgi:ATP-binding cassette subfamily F protein 3